MIGSKGNPKNICVNNVTAKGHLDQKWQDFRSTKAIKEDNQSKKDKENRKTNFVFAALEELNHKIYNNQTSYFS